MADVATRIQANREVFLNERIVAEKQQKLGECIFLRNYLPSMIDQIAYRAYSAVVVLQSAP